MEQLFYIEGMSCGGCVGSVTRAIESQAGVHSVAVSLADKLARVVFDPALTRDAAIRAAIEEAGYDVVG